jgi:iron complex outermembrane receptor protein
MKTATLRSLAGLSALLTFAALLPAQTAPATTTASSQTPTTTAGTSDVPLQLSDFVVSGTAASGYRATSSISATGIGTPIGDTPVTIDVVTQELISDTRSDLINDALRFVPGVTTQPTNESQPFVRAIQGTYTLRNGVFRRQNLDTWNVDDVEVIQGTSSIFYGNIRAGGIINYNTIKPVLGQNFATFDVDGGSFHYLRTEDAFNAGNDKFAVRVDLGYLNTNTFRTQENIQQHFADIGATWNITPNQQVNFEASTESVARVNSWSAYLSAITNTAYWGNPAAIASGQSVSAWMAANHPGMPVYNEFAPYGPAGDPYGRVTPIMRTYQDGLDKPVDFTYIAKVTDSLVFKAVLNYAWEDNEGINPDIGDPLANDTFTGVNASKFINVRDSYNANLRLTYRYDIPNIVNNTFMVGDDNQWVIQRYPQNAVLHPSTGHGIANTVTSNNLISSPNLTYTPGVTPELDGQGLLDASPGSVNFNATRDTLQDFGGAYFVEQAVLFNKSLFLILGDRFVNFKQEVWWPRQPVLESATSPNAEAKKWTPQIGGLYKIAGGPVSIFYSYSQAVQPQTQIDASGNAVDPILLKGWDAGVKFDLIGDTLTGTVDYFSIQQNNTAIANSALDIANGLPSNSTYGYYTYGNASELEGVQIDLSYNIGTDYQLIAGVNNFSKDEYVAPNSNPAIIGLPINPIPTTQFFAWNRYQFSSGPLKGLILGGGFNHNSPTIIGGGNVNYVGFYTPAFTVWSGMIGYDFVVAKHSIKAQLLVKNFTNLIYRDSGGVFGDPRTWVVSFTTRL